MDIKTIREMISGIKYDTFQFELKNGNSSNVSKATAWFKCEPVFRYPKGSNVPYPDKPIGFKNFTVRPNPIQEDEKPVV